jgi:hypothetical protein
MGKRVTSYQFRSHVPDGTALFVIITVFERVRGTRKAKISYFYLEFSAALELSAAKYNVLWSDVPVDDFLLRQLAESLQDLPGDRTHLVFSQNVSLLANVTLKCLTLAVLHQ